MLHVFPCASVRPSHLRAVYLLLVLLLLHHVVGEQVLLTLLLDVPQTVQLPWCLKLAAVSLANVLLSRLLL